MTDIPIAIPDIQLRALTHVVGHDGTDRTGRMAVADIGGSGTPGGANTQVQFNNAGVFGGDAGFTYVTGGLSFALGSTLQVKNGSSVLFEITTTGISFPDGSAPITFSTSITATSFSTSDYAYDDHGGFFGATGPSLYQDAGDGESFRLANIAFDGFGLLQFGGTFNPADNVNFPAVKRNGTALEVKLGNDSAYTNVKGKLTTETNYTAGAPTPAGYLVLYDAAGTAYKVPAVAV